MGPTNIYHVTAILTGGSKATMLVQAANAPLAGVEVDEVLKYKGLLSTGADIRRATTDDLERDDYDYIDPSLRDTQSQDKNQVAKTRVPKSAVRKKDIPSLLDPNDYL